MGAKSVIRVDIIGDARKLIGAVGEADRATGGLVKGAAVGAAGVKLASAGIRKSFDIIGDSLAEADRTGDAMTRLEQQLGGPLAQTISDTSRGFESIGASSNDILETSAAFADVATSAGIADETIAATAPTVAALGAAMALLGDTDADTVVSQIGKAAAGSEKPLKDLGVFLSDADVQARALTDSGKTTASALTESDLATARLALIMEQLMPKLTDATTGTSDLEQSQSELQAKTETLSAALGEKMAPALNAVLGFILDEIDAIPSAVDGFTMLGQVMVRSAEDGLAGYAALAQSLRDVIGLLPFVGDDTVRNAGGLARPGGSLAGKGEDDVSRNLQNRSDRNGGLRSLQGQP